MANNKKDQSVILYSASDKDLADLKIVKERLEQLPRDSLLYIAGAVNALSADSAANRPNA